MNKFFLIIACAITCSINTLFAQESKGRPAQAGEIVLQPIEKKETPSDVVFKHFSDFSTQLDNLAAGQISRVTELNDSAMLYLDAVYLFCSVRKGSCPWLLDAILETDIVNARINKSPDCPQMRLFWKLWIKNDLQRKHDFQIQTGFMRESMQFRKMELPRYLTCTKTVTTEIKLEDKGLTDAAFFKVRYSPADSRPKTAVKELVDFLEAIKAKNVDVFASVQMRVKEAESKDASKKTKPTSSKRKR